MRVAYSRLNNRHFTFKQLNTNILLQEALKNEKDMFISISIIASVYRL